MALTRLADAIDAAASAGSLSASSKAKTDGAAKSYKVTAKSGLNVRSGPSTSYGKYGALVCGAELQVEGIENGWAKVSYNGKTAYVSASYIKESGGGAAMLLPPLLPLLPAPASRSAPCSFGRTGRAAAGIRCWTADSLSWTALMPPARRTPSPSRRRHFRTAHRSARRRNPRHGRPTRFPASQTEMAAANGMTCMFLANSDPSYGRVEQYKQSDIAFLSKLCHEAGISLKATNNLIVLFDQEDYEKKSPVLTIVRGGGGSYTKHKLNAGTAGTQYASCRVSYTDPGTGKCIEATVKVEDYNDKAKNNQQLEITAKVASVAEAKQQVRKDRDLYAARQSGYRGRRHSQAHRLGCVGREIHCGAGCALGRLVRLYHAGQAAQDIGGILMDELQNILSRLVQTGTVTAVDSAKRRARVKFKDTGIISDWLYVLQHYGANFYIKPDAKHTHEITDTFTGGGTASEFPDHDHLPGLASDLLDAEGE